VMETSRKSVGGSNDEAADSYNKRVLPPTPAALGCPIGQGAGNKMSITDSSSWRASGTIGRNGPQSRLFKPKTVVRRPRRAAIINNVVEVKWREACRIGYFVAVRLNLPR
jgi:hypothetical protein